MARENIRRAAGTKTFTDLILHWSQNRRVARGLPATDPALDLVYLGEGQPLAVVAHRRTEERLQPGTLILHHVAVDPIVWFCGRFPRRIGPGAPMRAPIEIDNVYAVSGADAWRVAKRQFTMIDAHADGRAWVIAVPTIDLDLVLTAVSTADR